MAAKKRTAPMQTDSSSTPAAASTAPDVALVPGRIVHFHPLADRKLSASSAQPAMVLEVVDEASKRVNLKVFGRERDSYVYDVPGSGVRAQSTWCDPRTK
jgi:hypothetical protein